MLLALLKGPKTQLQPSHPALTTLPKPRLSLPHLQHMGTARKNHLCLVGACAHVGTPTSAVHWAIKCIPWSAQNHCISTTAVLEVWLAICNWVCVQSNTAVYIAGFVIGQGCEEFAVQPTRTRTLLKGNNHNIAIPYLIIQCAVCKTCIFAS